VDFSYRELVFKKNPIILILFETTANHTDGVAGKTTSAGDPGAISKMVNV